MNIFSSLINYHDQRNILLLSLYICIFPDIVCLAVIIKFMNIMTLCGHEISVKHTHVPTKTQSLFCVCVFVLLVSMNILIKLRRPHIEGMIYPVYTGYKESDHLEDGESEQAKHQIHAYFFFDCKSGYPFYFILWHLFLKA